MNRQDFWPEVFKVTGSVTPYVLGRVSIFCLFGLLVYLVEDFTGIQTGFAIAPYEIVGVVLALLLVLRTNAGYDRWYEARKLWGGIVNQCRNLAVIGTVYGPRDESWTKEYLGWTAAFAHACRHSLRGESDLQDLEQLLGKRQAAQLAAADHQPMYVAGRLAKLLREAVSSGQMDRFAFMQAEHERATLIDHIGACERIMRTRIWFPGTVGAREQG